METIRDIVLEKVAMASKVQKMYDMGKLSIRNANKATLPKPSTAAAIHNKINSKAKRMAEIAAQTGRKSTKMNATKYKNLSKTNNIRATAPIDSNRARKFYGNKVNQTIKDAREGGALVRTVENARDPSLHSKFFLDGSGREYEINAPGAGDIYQDVIDFIENRSRTPWDKFPDNFKRNIRKNTSSALWAHEGAHELGNSDAMIRWSKIRGKTLHNNRSQGLQFGSHFGPRVLSEDAELLKKLDPLTKYYFDSMRSTVKSGVVLNGVPIPESVPILDFAKKHNGTFSSAHLGRRDEIMLNKAIAYAKGRISEEDAESITRFTQKLTKHKDPVPDKILLPYSKK